MPSLPECAGFALAMAASTVAAASPVPFFREVGSVGVLCAVAAPQDLLDEGRLCGWAAAELAAGMPAGGPAVVALVRNDPRLADPGLLLVTLHAHLVPAGPDGPALLALAAGLHRARTDLGPPPLFTAPPEALPVPGGTPPEAAVRSALRRLLGTAVTGRLPRSP
ncbi:hypothetical protein HL658_33825 [Azospirillum sp. RWY-5-1]|uniref:Secreted protein n=1 Tax=Azospirillum oleiclasticum TaxID=2735135 RepID=A0ABX2TM84_9PROT|nr:hypothetical protein [Azospirillum oleiclasticum]NYZ17549.1 hypothetical protein [Azospirillum oleiclasticum]NYZ24651.1 hypothetical protein [Azospirillum oleiclasticum]